MPANFNADRFDFRRPVQLAEVVELLPAPTHAVQVRYALVMPNFIACMKCRGPIAVNVNFCPACGMRRGGSHGKGMGVGVGLALGGVFAVVIGVAKIKAGDEKAVAPSSNPRRSSLVADAAVEVAIPTLPTTIEKIMALIKKSNMPGGGTLDVDQFDTNGIKYTFRADGHGSRGESQAISDALVRLTLKELVAHGFDPKAEMLSVVAHVHYAAEASVTGREQVRVFGKSSYDWNDDRVVWTAE